MRYIIYFSFMILVLSCSSIDEQLNTAIESGDLSKVQKIILKEGFKDYDFSENNLISKSLDYERYDIAKCLANSEMNITITDRGFIYRLMNKEQWEILDILILKGKIDQKTLIPEAGYSLFYWVCKQENLRLLDSFSLGEQNLNEIYKGDSILYLIVKNYGGEGINTIFDVDQLSIRDEKGISLLRYSIAFGDIEAIEFIISSGYQDYSRVLWYKLGNQWEESFSDYFFNDSYGITYLNNANSSLISGMITNHKLDYEEKKKLIKKFIDLDIETQSPDNDGYKPFDYAVELGYGAAIAPLSDSDKEWRKMQRLFGSQIINLLNGID